MMIHSITYKSLNTPTRNEERQKELPSYVHLFLERMDFVPIEFKRFPLHVRRGAQKWFMKLMMKHIHRAVIGERLPSPLRIMPKVVSPSEINDSQLKNINLKKWMEHLPPEVKKWPFNKLHFPGTHNSCMYKITRNQLPIEAPFMQVAEMAAGQFKEIYHIIEDLCTFHTKSIKEQLEVGIRFLDVRYSEHDHKFFGAHEMAGPSLERVFQEIADFLNENKEEVVVLSLRREDYYDFGDEYTDECVIKLVYKILGSLLTEETQFDSAMSISEMAKRNKRVILIDRLDTDLYEDLRWRWSTCKRPSTSASKTKKKLGYLKTEVSEHEPNKKKINGIQFIVSVGRYEILENRLTGVCDQTMSIRRSSMQSLIQEFLRDNGKLMIKKDVALVTTDYPEELFTRSIIALNDEKLERSKRSCFNCCDCCQIV